MDISLWLGDTQKAPCQLQRPLNQDNKTENNRRDNANQRENKYKRGEKKKKNNQSNSQIELVSTFLFLKRAWAISQGTVIHRLERAQQCSWCRIPTCTKVFMDHLGGSGIREQQQVGQHLPRLSYLLTTPTAWCHHASFLHSTPDHCFQHGLPLQSSHRKNERGMGGEESSFLFWRWGGSFVGFFSCIKEPSLAN